MNVGSLVQGGHLRHGSNRDSLLWYTDPQLNASWRTISTAGLIAILETEFQPHGEDAEIFPELNDTRFAQRVHNLVCARWQECEQDKASDVLGLAPAIRQLPLRPEPALGQRKTSRRARAS